MRVAVTGSSGLIGRALTDALTLRGDVVIPFVRNRGSASAGSVRWDPSRGYLDGDDLGAVGPIDAVVHLAGAGIADRRWSRARKSEILASRVDGTHLLAKSMAGLATPPRSFVSGSAIGYYGNGGDNVLDESSPLGEGFLAEVCHQWEEATKPASDRGLAVAFARTGIVMSTRGGALKRQLPLFRLGLGGRLGRGTQWTSLISLHDEVQALLFLLDGAHQGPFNLVAPEPLTNNDFTKSLGAILHRPTWLGVPGFALKVALGGQLANEALLASQRVVPTRLLEAGFTFRDASASAILTQSL